MPPAAYSAAHRSQNPKDHAQNQQDDPNRPEDANVEDRGKDETDDSENDQVDSSIMVENLYPMSPGQKRLAVRRDSADFAD